MKKSFGQNMFNDVYKEKKVFVTGHTGFMGSWLVLWLLNLGARVSGYALEPATQPNHYDVLSLDHESMFSDIRDRQMVYDAIYSFQPDIVFHLAAQSIVRRSYKHPVETFETNVIGTVNILDACRKVNSVRAIVNVTSDKCYENREWIWGYRESDPLGGYDPYSTSKGCAELVTAGYRKSFFPVKEYNKNHHTLVASVRAGNVVGGGDWGEDRLIPDIMRAASKHEKAIIRSPESVRPWQHVLEPLGGYLLLGQKLLEGKKDFSGAWNFGPNNKGHRSVLEVIELIRDFWDDVDYRIVSNEKNPHEARLLKLDCSKAYAKIGWRPVWNSSNMLLKTAQWYRKYYDSGVALSQEQLAEYISDARQMNMNWACDEDS